MRCSADSAGQPGATLPARVQPFLQNLVHGKAAHGAALLGESGFCQRREENRRGVNGNGGIWTAEKVSLAPAADGTEQTRSASSEYVLLNNTLLS